MRRKIFASKETEFIASKSTGNIVKVYSFFPVDRANCDCKKMIRDWKNKLALNNEKERKEMVAKQEFLVCPRNKSGMNRYKITCSKCGTIQGYCWASDSSLTDWCDFHYVQWTKGDYWRGCFTPHISPITQQLLFECTCGQDTRDFRANMTLNQAFAEDIERTNFIGREMNKPDSKFVATVVKNVIL